MSFSLLLNGLVKVISFKSADIPLVGRLKGLAERRELPSGVQGDARANNEFGAFLASQNTSGVSIRNK